MSRYVTPVLQVLRTETRQHVCIMIFCLIRAEEEKTPSWFVVEQAIMSDKHILKYVRKPEPIVQCFIHLEQWKLFIFLVRRRNGCEHLIN